MKATGQPRRTVYWWVWTIGRVALVRQGLKQFARDAGFPERVIAEQLEDLKRDGFVRAAGSSIYLERR
jgi:hypothetical protein